MTSNKQCVHKKLLNASLALNAVSLVGLVVVVMFVSLLSQRTAKLESIIAVKNEDLYVGK